MGIIIIIIIISCGCGVINFSSSVSRPTGYWNATSFEKMYNSAVSQIDRISGLVNRAARRISIAFVTLLSKQSMKCMS